MLSWNVGPVLEKGFSHKSMVINVGPVLEKGFSHKSMVIVFRSEDKMRNSWSTLLGVVLLFFLYSIIVVQINYVRNDP